MKPCLKPKLSMTALTTGPGQLVVHGGFEMMWCLAGSFFSWFTPMTMVMSSPLAGAEITTFLAPAVRCLDALSLSVKRPVLSSTSSTPSSFHGSFSGSLMADTLICLPFTISASPFASTVPGNRPCTESYLRRCASVFVSVMSLTPTNSRSPPACFVIVAARNTFRPMRPNPLIPTRTAMTLPLREVWNCCAGECYAHDSRRAGLLQRPRRFGEGGTGGEHVFDEYQNWPGWTRFVRDRERPRHARHASLRWQRSMRRRLARAREQVRQHGHFPLSAQRARERVALIVTALPQSLRRERNGNEGRRTDGPIRKTAHRRRHIVGDARKSAILERMHGRSSTLGQPDGGAH